MMWVEESDEGYENYISFKQLLTKRLYKEGSTSNVGVGVFPITPHPT
ncbi:hypothetical protein [Bacillus kexueae]|nr:hypothetical protein [Bacillus kexueae]